MCYSVILQASLKGRNACNDGSSHCSVVPRQHGRSRHGTAYGNSRDRISVRCLASRTLSWSGLPSSSGLPPFQLGNLLEDQMNALIKTARFLIAAGGVAVSYVTPLSADNVQFYNSPAAAATKPPFSQAV